MRAHNSSPIQGLLAAAAMVAATLLAIPQASAADATPLSMATGGPTLPPFGWTKFCIERPQECQTEPAAEREVALSVSAWAELERINKWVNATIKPKRDLEHYGEVDKWTYPDDGYGDCEDYVLLKRRMLMEAGWPREALLITVVIDHNGEGHAVLTVRTDRGEFLLDNLREDIVPATKSSYRFIKRQLQTNPNFWVSLGGPRSTVATAASR
jgi:predicted transglutaminase-like cysteine proteinase